MNLDTTNLRQIFNELKIKSRPSKKVRPLKCPRCGDTNCRKRGLTPTNTQKSSKGWHGSYHPKYQKECVERTFQKRYICQNCKKTFNYGNSEKS